MHQLLRRSISSIAIFSIGFGVFITPLYVFDVPEVSAYVSPGKPSGYLNDFVGIFSVDAKKVVEDKLVSYQKETGNEISVVVIKELGNETIETYATQLFSEWGIGKESQDNGALLLVAFGNREVRIEVGYGLEPYLTDAASSRIIRETIIPAFKNGEYELGIELGVDRMIAGLTDSEDLTQERTTDSRGKFIESIFPFLIIMLIQLIPVIIYSKSWWLGGVLGLGLGFLFFSSIFGIVGFALFGLLADFFLSKKFVGKKPEGGGHGGVWFGGFGGGRGGGGFGGFGGGMSGGGGSSGRW